MENAGKSDEEEDSNPLNATPISQEPLEKSIHEVQTSVQEDQETPSGNKDTAAATATDAPFPRLRKIYRIRIKNKRYSDFETSPSSVRKKDNEGTLAVNELQTKVTEKAEAEKNVPNGENHGKEELKEVSPESLSEPLLAQELTSDPKKPEIDQSKRKRFKPKALRVTSSGQKSSGEHILKNLTDRPTAPTLLDEAQSKNENKNFVRYATIRKKRIPLQTVTKTTRIRLKNKRYFDFDTSYFTVKRKVSGNEITPPVREPETEEPGKGIISEDHGIQGTKKNPQESPEDFLLANQGYKMTEGEDNGIQESKKISEDTPSRPSMEPLPENGDHSKNCLNLKESLQESLEPPSQPKPGAEQSFAESSLENQSEKKKFMKMTYDKKTGCLKICNTTSALESTSESSLINQPKKHSQPKPGAEQSFAESLLENQSEKKKLMKVTYDKKTGFLKICKRTSALESPEESLLANEGYKKTGGEDDEIQDTKKRSQGSPSRPSMEQQPGNGEHSKSLNLKESLQECVGESLEPKPVAEQSFAESSLEKQSVKKKFRKMTYDKKTGCLKICNTTSALESTSESSLINELKKQRALIFRLKRKKGNGECPREPPVVQGPSFKPRQILLKKKAFETNLNNKEIGSRNPTSTSTEELSIEKFSSEEEESRDVQKDKEGEENKLQMIGSAIFDSTNTDSRILDNCINNDDKRTTAFFNTLQKMPDEAEEAEEPDCEAGESQPDKDISNSTPMVLPRSTDENLQTQSSTCEDIFDIFGAKDDGKASPFAEYFRSSQSPVADSAPVTVRSSPKKPRKELATPLNDQFEMVMTSDLPNPPSSLEMVRRHLFLGNDTESSMDSLMDESSKTSCMTSEDGDDAEVASCDNNSGGSLDWDRVERLERSLKKKRRCMKEFVSHEGHVISLKGGKTMCWDCDVRVCPMCHGKHGKFLRFHLKATITDREHRCGVCDISFKSKCALECHESIHTGPPFFCPDCTTRYMKPRHFLQHCPSKCLHWYLLPQYRCTACAVNPIKIMSRKNFQKHIREHITNCITCQICGSKFESSSQAGKHASSVHGVDFADDDDLSCGGIKQERWCGYCEASVGLEHTHSPQEFNSSSAYVCPCKMAFEKLAHFQKHLKICQQTLVKSISWHTLYNKHVGNESIKLSDDDISKLDMCNFCHEIRPSCYLQATTQLDKKYCSKCVLAFSTCISCKKTLRGKSGETQCYKCRFNWIAGEEDVGEENSDPFEVTKVPGTSQPDEHNYTLKYELKMKLDESRVKEVVSNENEARHGTTCCFCQHAIPSLEELLSHFKKCHQNVTVPTRVPEEILHMNEDLDLKTRLMILESQPEESPRKKVVLRRGEFHRLMKRNQRRQTVRELWESRAKADLKISDTDSCEDNDDEMEVDDDETETGGDTDDNVPEPGEALDKPGIIEDCAEKGAGTDEELGEDQDKTAQEPHKLMLNNSHEPKSSESKKTPSKCTSKESPEKINSNVTKLPEKKDCTADNSSRKNSEEETRMKDYEFWDKFNDALLTIESRGQRASVEILPFYKNKRQVKKPKRYVEEIDSENEEPVSSKKAKPSPVSSAQSTPTSSQVSSKTENEAVAGSSEPKTDSEELVMSDETKTKKSGGRKKKERLEDYYDEDIEDLKAELAKDDELEFITRNFEKESKECETRGRPKRSLKPSSRMKFIQIESASVPEPVRTTDDVKLKCSVCSVKFETRSEFITHIKEHRNDEDTFQCMECGACFVVRASLQKHLRAFHQIEDTASYIEKNACNGMLDRIEPEDLAENQCKVCRLILASALDLKKHFRVHGVAFLKDKVCES